MLFISLLLLGIIALAAIAIWMVQSGLAAELGDVAAWFAGRR